MPQTPSRRRNGLQPACEPCRKAKVRCDNTSSASICSRCRKRQTPELCIFLDAPMTGKAKPRTKSQTMSPGRPALCSGTPNANNGYAPKSERGYGSTGFFGQTSFTATIHQATKALNGIHDDFDDDVQVVGIDCKMGSQVLRQFPSLPICYKLIDLFSESSGEVAFPKAIVMLMFQVLGTKYPSIWEGDPQAKDLLPIAREITKNTHTPLSGPDAADEWEVLFSENIRWEAVGILYCALCFGTLSLGDKDPLFSSEGGLKMDRMKFVRVMKGCIESCISICRNSPNSLNVLLCSLLYKNLLLETVIEGISVWRLHHDLVAISTAMGLHCYQGKSNVTLHSEMTKRLSANCFWQDKEISMFTGRPPALSRRYHSCPLPLDISDEALNEGGDALRAEIDSLDENGWNTKGVIHNATISRMSTLAAMIQDEIMELFIGNQEHFSIERVNALKVKTLEIYKHAPSVLDISKETLINTESDLLLWRLLFHRLDYLRVIFFLERLSHERGHSSKQKLLEVARELVELTVFIWLQRDRSAGRHYDYDYSIMCYGMPATGILCVSLLKQSQLPSSIPASDKLPTAEVVQSLSLMISFLEWIKPSAGNYKLCQRMAKVIRRVLDQAFEPPLTPEAGEAVWADDSLNWTGMVDEMNDLDWVNSIDWSRGPYMEIPSIPA